MRAADQASRLRDLVHQAPTARTIAVCSGKGGVGKSNVCLNLGILLSAAGHRVALVDADLGLANLDILMDLEVRGNLSHVIAGTRTLEEVTLDLPTGVQFVPGACGLADLVDLSEFDRGRLVRELAALEDENDLILVDCGAGIGASVLTFAAAADQVVVVTTPEPPAVTDAYALIKVLRGRQFAGQVGLVVNLAANRQQARQTYHRIADVAGRFLDTQVTQLGYVLTDSRVPEAVLQREPVVLAYPRALASRCLATVANRLSQAGITQDPGQRQGFFGKVVNWFM